MKEFVEKLIGRFKEEKETYRKIRKNTHCRRTEMDDCDSCRADHYLDARLNCVDNLISIVNQLAEEYNNGWIPCERELPETYEYVLVWCKGIFIDGTHVGEECEWYGIGVRYGKEWTVYQCKDIRDIEVLAWMPLPEPYQKGSE